MDGTGVERTRGLPEVRGVGQGEGERPAVDVDRPHAGMRLPERGRECDRAVTGTEIEDAGPGCRDGSPPQQEVGAAIDTGTREDTVIGGEVEVEIGQGEAHGAGPGRPGRLGLPVAPTHRVHDARRTR